MIMQCVARDKLLFDTDEINCHAELVEAYTPLPLSDCRVVPPGNDGTATLKFKALRKLIPFCDIMKPVAISTICSISVPTQKKPAVISGLCIILIFSGVSGIACTRSLPV